MVQLVKTARGRITTEHGEDAGRSFPHVGIDIGHGNETDDDLLMVAPAAGMVLSAGWSGTYGNRVVILHEDLTWSLIAHMASLEVKAGDRVAQRQKIGVMGRTGGPWGSIAGWFVHGHQEYHLANGTAVNPLDYISATAEASTLIPLEEDDMYTDADRARDDIVAWQVGRIKANMDDLAAGNGKVHEKLDLTLWALSDPGKGLRKIISDLAAKLTK